MWGRAQREATRRCASDWGHNLGKARVKIPLVATSRVPNSVTLAYTAHRTFFAQRGRNRCRSRVFLILDIFIRSGDVCERSLKWSKIDPNFARFWPPTFWGMAAQIWGPNLSCGRTFR